MRCGRACRYTCKQQAHLPFPRHQHHRPPLPLFECAHVKIIHPVVFLQHSQVGLLGQCVPRCAGGDLLVEGVDGVEVVVDLWMEHLHLIKDL